KQSPRAWCMGVLGYLPDHASEASFRVLHGRITAIPIRSAVVAHRRADFSRFTAAKVFRLNRRTRNRDSHVVTAIRLAVIIRPDFLRIGWTRRIIEIGTKYLTPSFQFRDDVGVGKLYSVVWMWTGRNNGHR